MKKFLQSFWGMCVITIVSMLLPTKSNAQYVSGPSFTEIGITLGPSNFLGDLGGGKGKGTYFLKDNNFKVTKFMAGAHVTYYPKDWLGIRVAANFGTLEGDDAIIKGKGGLEEARRARNLNFKSSIFEGLLAAEVYPFVFREEDATDVYHKFRPYGVVGIGYFHFNPKGQNPTTGQWVNLQPLRTEAQGLPGRPKQYKLWQLNIPLGIGIKYWLNDNTSLGFEAIHRKTFTDYIDDVSTTYASVQELDQANPADHGLASFAVQMANKSGTNPDYAPGRKRGDPSKTDSYYSVGFKLGIRLNTDGGGWRNSTRCPVIRF